VQGVRFLGRIVEIDRKVLLRREAMKGGEHDAHDFQASGHFFAEGRHPVILLWAGVVQPVFSRERSLGPDALDFLSIQEIEPLQNFEKVENRDR